ncbi:hypothetical protein D5086_021676 [Populus alba]|uniref:Uncharacterized protein n=1 Tax=Populus alba TaxID=43335 RepID=A0ACC4BEJ2_POPAL
MEAEQIRRQPCKFSRVGNGINDTSRIAQKGNGTDHQYPDDEEDGELKRTNSNNGAGCGGGGIDAAGGTFNGLRAWHHSSRIIRVSRASGGKDRHSKVWTSKGLRDRRVRLSVSTAIQFYDLQDRLGYDQPSKAVEWLIKAAQDAINELPSLNHSFPDTPKQLSDEKKTSDSTEQGFDSADVELEDPNFRQNQNLSLSKSACSSTSETSKGSGLSLSRSVSRDKARERARERTAKEKEKENDSRMAHHHNINPISQNSTFTELLTGGVGQIQLGNSIPQALTMSIPPFCVSGENHQEHLQHFPFVSDHLIPVAATTQPPASSGDYNLNFTISSGLAAGFNRGTLQSNSSSPSLLPHLQRFSTSSTIDGSTTNVPFFIGAATPQAMENHHQFPPGLQLCYGDGTRHSDQKGKGKN